VACSADCIVNMDDSMVFSILSQLKKSYSPREFDLPTVWFKSFAVELSTPLSMVFQRSYFNCDIPPLLRCADVIPVFKKGDKRLVSNYRPISIVSICGKVLDKLLSFCSRNKLLDPRQHGFVPDRSTCSQLLVMTQEWLEIVNRRGTVHCVYIDLKGAYDRVVHSRLLLKLSNYGFRGLMSITSVNF